MGEIMTGPADPHEAFFKTGLGALFLSYANTSANANYLDGAQAGPTGLSDGAVKAAWGEAIAARKAFLDALANVDTLRVENPDLHAQFAAICPTAPLPWNIGPDAPWLICDASGQRVVEIDDSDDARGVALMILTAVNTCGGFRAERVPDQPAADDIEF